MTKLSLKRTLKTLALCLFVVIFVLYGLGAGWNGEPLSPGNVTDGPRELVAAPAVEGQQVLFGDLHVHTNYSLDAAIFNSPLVKGVGVFTPADACDFARYCSALDFWSINDHAEGLSPRVWQKTLASIRQCNEKAGDPANPDMVSFAGWEWSNSNQGDPDQHFGHKNVVFRTWEPGQVPSRPISSQERYPLEQVPSVIKGVMSLMGGIEAMSGFNYASHESSNIPICPEDIPADQLPDDCREVALTPKALYRKLDEWGFDSLVVPHGLSWGTTNPALADFKNQLDQHEQRYQKLLEVYSGHGNSERYEDFTRVGVKDSGELFCPSPTEDFTPCCHAAGQLVRAECDKPNSVACDQKVDKAVNRFLEKGDGAGRRALSQFTVQQWQGCGQFNNAFQPAFDYVPRQSAQYNLALGFDETGKPKRARLGLIGSSDNHQARPGTGYKETDRIRYTDTKEIGEESIVGRFIDAAPEKGGFYYTGGLVAVHAEGRNRDAIWQGLDRRNTYATSGERMLLWFDLLNGPEGKAVMGSEVNMSAMPRFRVRALGAFKQKPGCPSSTEQLLGRERMEFLCGSECYNPSDKRKAITRIEVVKIKPQASPDEVVESLVDNSWRVFDCPADGNGCVIEFEDSEFTSEGRDTLYYVRAIQQPQLLINGDPFACEYDEQGVCVKRNYCIGKNATPDNNCLAEAEPRAWSSPIFVDYR